MIPKIAIVGRPNVGKSSLLNMLAGRRIAIVDETAGVTRDRIASVIELQNSDKKSPVREVEVIDTGGYGIEDSQNLTADVEKQIAFAMAEAHLILFVVDVQTGLTPLDHEVAQLLRTSDSKTPIMLVANKVDGESLETDAYEAAALGFDDPICISATSKYNRRLFIDAVLEKIDFYTINALPDPQEISAEEGEGAMKLAIVGKRNAGKSTLVNALAGGERVIVSDIEGTTRDSVDVRFKFNDRPFVAIDTAGLRKRKSIKEDIEYYSYHRALRSIRRADVVCLLLDASVRVSQVDVKLLHEIIKHDKPCILVINKWDLAEEGYTQEEYTSYLDDALNAMSYAPIAFLSAANSEGLDDLIETALELYDQAGQRVSTGEMNRVMEEILSRNLPSSKGGKRLKVYYVTQLETYPPTIGLFVNDPTLFSPEYQRFMINRFREMLPFPEVPIKLVIRERRRMPKGVHLSDG